jgi:nicotinamidase-related amidase
LPTGSVLVGSSLDETILSTAIDGFHRGYHHQIISDAVACKTAVGQTADYRETVLHLLGSYSGRVCSEAVLRLAS